MSNIPCTIPCDYCKQPGAHWFGDTSVAVCDKPECQQRNQSNWERHLEEMESERRVDDLLEEMQ